MKVHASFMRQVFYPPPPPKKKLWYPVYGRVGDPYPVQTWRDRDLYQESEISPWSFSLQSQTLFKLDRESQNGDHEEFCHLVYIIMQPGESRLLHITFIFRIQEQVKQETSRWQTAMSADFHQLQSIISQSKELYTDFTD